MSSMKGRYSAMLINKDGSVDREIPEFDNVICDGAFNFQLPFHETVPMMCIGTGVVTEPQSSDTDLGNQVSAVRCSDNVGGAGNWPKLEHHTDGTGDYVKMTWNASFSGPLTGVSEVGMRYGVSTGTLLSRSLIKDSQGNSITIDVLEGQTLVLYYHVYVSVPSDGVFGSGVISTPHGDSNFTVKPDGWPTLHISYGTMLYFGGMLDLSGFRNSELSLNGSSTKVSVEILNETYDAASKTATAQYYLEADNLDRTFGSLLIKQDSVSGTSFNATTGERNKGYVVVCAVIKFETPITIPANYDWTINIEVNGYTGS